MSEGSNSLFLVTLGNLLWAMNYLESPKFIANQPWFVLERDSGVFEVKWTADQAATMYNLFLLDPKLEVSPDYDSVWIAGLGWVEVLENGNMQGYNYADAGGRLYLNYTAFHLDSLTPSIKLQRKYRCQQDV